MAKSIFNQLAVATAGLALSLVAIEVQFTTNAQAAVITYDFEATAFEGASFPIRPFGPGDTINSFTGSFSYNDSLGTSDGSTEVFSLLSYTNSYTDNLYDSPFGRRFSTIKVKTENGSFLGLFGYQLPFDQGGFVVQYKGNIGEVLQRTFDPSLPPPDAVYFKQDLFNINYSLRKSQC